MLSSCNNAICRLRASLGHAILLLMKKNHVLLALCVIVFLVVNGTTLHNGHNWGDDFSHYIRHGLNILQGRPYSSSVMLDHWGATPPAFPLLLTPVLKIAGLNFVWLKFPNLVYWLLTCLVLWLAGRRRLQGETSELLFLCLLSSPFFFLFKQNILSDLPFTLFYCAALFFLEKRTQQQDDQKSTTILFWGLLFAALTLLTRLAGIALFAAILVHALFIKKDWKMAGGTVLAGGIALVILYAFGVSFGDPMTAFPRSPSAILIQAFLNIAYVSGLLFNFFMPVRTPFNAFLLDHGLPVLRMSAPFLYFIVFAVGGVKLYRRTISLPFLSFLSYSVLILLWPALEPRYVLPLAPWLLIFACSALERGFAPSGKGPAQPSQLKSRLTQVLLATLILHNCLSIGLGYRMNDDEINQPVNRELFAWVRNNTRPEERLMFHYPRALWLLTGRPSTSFFVSPDQRGHLTDRLIEHRIDYLILMPQGRNLHLLNTLDPVRVRWEKVWENPQYAIFRIQRLE